MSATLAPEVLANPTGVIVDLVVQYDPGVDRVAVTDVVGAVAGGRAKRRRLAQALLDRPTVLADGRSPAPRAVADLLIALRTVGATRISPPVCSQCGKPLRTFQRRGEDWYCAVCGPRRQTCAGCGQHRPVNMRDRDGRPRCAQCPPDHGRDPVAAVVAVVAGVEPRLPADDVAAAVKAQAPRAGQRYQLAWALQERRGLLTGAGAEAPVPSVLRLIDALVDLGAQTITHPPCPRCGRLIRLHRPIGGQWLCRNCVAKSRAQPCARCGAVREAATRDEHGRPLCPNCLITDPANLETCVGCSRRRPVSVRTPDGPLCAACRPVKTITCSICGRRAPGVTSTTTGAALVHRLQAAVGQLRRLRPGAAHPQRHHPPGPVVRHLHPNRAGILAHVPGCGQPGRIHTGRCARCDVEQRLRDLLGDGHGQIRPQLRALHQTLATTERPATVAAWLNRSAAPAILRDLQTGTRPLTHETLDELPAGKPVEHLRSVLVAVGTLPHRDEHMVRLERWSARVIAQRSGTAERRLLHRYAVWHVTRRLRGRLAGADTTHEQAVAAQRNIRAAVALLDWLATRGLTLASAHQGDLEAWLTSAQPTHRVDTGNFVRWARKQKLTRLDFAAIRWGGPTGTIDTETRWAQARWLLHDDTVKPEDRLAALLVLLYAQWPADISRLTVDHIHADDQQVRIRLGREPIVLPEPLATLVHHVLATRQGHAAIGDQQSTPWLFPGGQPARPISSFRMAERLRQLGIRSGQSRSTALFQLATELPAAVLARMLGIHISVAVAWQRASAGDWTSYAADVARRARQDPTSQ